MSLLTKCQIVRNRGDGSCHRISVTKLNDRQVHTYTKQEQREWADLHQLDRIAKSKKPMKGRTMQRKGTSKTNNEQKRIFI